MIKKCILYSVLLVRMSQIVSFTFNAAIIDGTQNFKYICLIRTITCSQQSLQGWLERAPPARPQLTLGEWTQHCVQLRFHNTIRIIGCKYSRIIHSNSPAPLRIPPGVNLIPWAVNVSTAASKSSIQRPMWFSAGMCTFGAFSGSMGCMRSISTVFTPVPSTKISSSTFSFCSPMLKRIP